jgi:hypothetical protein
VWSKVCYDVGIMSRVRSLLCVLCLGFMVSCLSPTLPLPPPEPPSASASTTPGMVQLVGHAAQGNALIVITNANPSLPSDEQVGGTWADANGDWLANVYASNGDTLHIWQEIGSTQSPYIVFTVKLP